MRPPPLSAREEGDFRDFSHLNIVKQVFKRSKLNILEHREFSVGVCKV